MTLHHELTKLLNRYNTEQASNTPDFLLAEFLIACLAAYNMAVQSRATWYGRMDVPGRGSVPFPGTPGSVSVKEHEQLTFDGVSEDDTQLPF